MKVTEACGVLRENNKSGKVMNISSLMGSISYAQSHGSYRGPLYRCSKAAQVQKHFKSKHLTQKIPHGGGSVVISNQTNVMKFCGFQCTSSNFCSIICISPISMYHTPHQNICYIQSYQTTFSNIKKIINDACTLIQIYSASCLHILKFFDRSCVYPRILYK